MLTLVVLFGLVYFFGIFSLVVDTMLEKRSIVKAKSIPTYQHKSTTEEIFKINLEEDDEETFTVL